MTLRDPGCGPGNRVVLLRVATAGPHPWTTHPWPPRCDRDGSLVRAPRLACRSLPGPARTDVTPRSPHRRTHPSNPSMPARPPATNHPRGASATAVAAAHTSKPHEGAAVTEQKPMLEVAVGSNPTYVGHGQRGTVSVARECCPRTHTERLVATKRRRAHAPVPTPTNDSLDHSLVLNCNPVPLLKV